MSFCTAWPSPRRRIWIRFCMELAYSPAEHSLRRFKKKGVLGFFSLTEKEPHLKGPQICKLVSHNFWTRKLKKKKWIGQRLEKQMLLLSSRQLNQWLCYTSSCGKWDVTNDGMRSSPTCGIFFKCVAFTLQLVSLLVWSAVPTISRYQNNINNILFI